MVYNHLKAFLAGVGENNEKFLPLCKQVVKNTYFHILSLRKKKSIFFQFD